MKRTFSAYWSSELGRAIQERYDQLTDHRAGESWDHFFEMSLLGKDHLRCIKAVNEGIDASLEACYVPSRGDRYVCCNGLLECHVSRESLPVLVRRLLEPGDEVGASLASVICEVLGIELV